MRPEAINRKRVYGAKPNLPYLQHPRDPRRVVSHDKPESRNCEGKPR